MGERLEQVTKADLIEAIREVFRCVGSPVSEHPLILHDYNSYDGWTSPSGITQSVYRQWQAEARALLEGECD